MTQNQPALSVVVAAYQSEATIAECMESILGQTFRALELIVVDDGSKDATAEIARTYAQKDDRVRVIVQENAGSIAARRAGTDLAAAPWVTYVDADDWIDADMYAVMMQEAADKDADVVACGFVREYPDGRQEIYRDPLPGGVYEGEALAKVKETLLFNGTFYATSMAPAYWNKIFKKDRIAPFLKDADAQIRMGEDVAVTVPTLLHADRIVILGDHTPYHYRIVPQSMSHGYDSLYFVRMDALHTHLRRIVDRRGLPKEAQALSYYMLFLLMHGVESAAPMGAIGPFMIGRMYDALEEKYGCSGWIADTDLSVLNPQDRRIAQILKNGSGRGLAAAILKKGLHHRLSRRG